MDPGSSETPSRINTKKLYIHILFLSYIKSKIKKKILKEAIGKKHLTYGGISINTDF